MLNSWQFDLIAALIFGIIFFQCYKLAVSHAKHDGAATIIIQCIAGLSTLFFIPFSKIYFPNNPKVFLLLLFASIFYAVSDRLQTTVRKHLEVSEYSILGQLSNVFQILYGFLLFREPVVFSKIIGAILIISGNILLQKRGKKFVFNKYVGFAVLSAIALATAITIDIDNSRNMTLPIYISITFLVPSLVIFLSERIGISTLKQEIQHLDIKYALLTGFSWSGLIYFLLRAYQLQSVTTIVPLQSTLVLWNVVIAAIFLKERDYIPQKIAAAILVIIGIIATIL